MEKNKTTTITISMDLWRYLVSNRLDTRETLEDVIWKFIRDDTQKVNKLNSQEEKQ
jgi:hypothetical protein